ncbi:aromatic ring-hydroxylating dioxygenase subunit alpha [Hyphococcus sp.]|uniref:aromatic ring-hydroxylating dioxygenase subunit alpha n=1 Tax=Hyphococcus sp. TaxID=2038636 RepID=UPI0035C70ADF
MYVRNAWYVASWTQDLEAGKPFAIDILGEPIVIWRNEQGVLTALEDRCVHRLAPLSLGRCEGDKIRCMYHGFLYERDGRIAEIPGQDKVPETARIKSYPVVDRHSWIWVWMGAPELADETLIPPAVGFDNPDYILGRGQLDYDAEARLINDNLCDFSHLTFVHAESFGPGEQFAISTPTVAPLDRGVRFSRWIEASPGRKRAAGNGAPSDTWRTYDYLIPGVLVMTGGDYPVGYAKARDYAPPHIDDAIGGVTFTSQAVTPMTEKTSRYFFSWGPHVRHGDEKLRDLLMNLAAKAFAEDKTIIEAQQKIIDKTDAPRVLPSAHDRGVTMFNRLVERLAKEEQQRDASAA